MFPFMYHPVFKAALPWMLFVFVVSTSMGLEYWLDLNAETVIVGAVLMMVCQDRAAHFYGED